jgi:hypothetical protein
MEALAPSPRLRLGLFISAASWVDGPDQQAVEIFGAAVCKLGEMSAGVNRVDAAMSGAGPLFPPKLTVTADILDRPFGAISRH